MMLCTWTASLVYWALYTTTLTYNKTARSIIVLTSTYATKNTQDYIWHELEELPLVDTDIVIAQNSSFADLFTELVAERLQAYPRTYEVAIAPPKKCTAHLFPKPETKVSQT